MPQADSNIQDHFGTVVEEGEHSYVEWRLQDVNGDGHPDVVYNGSYVQAASTNFAPPQLPPPPGIQFTQIDAIWSAHFTGSTAVKALINVAGVHLSSTGTSAFSAPVVLVDDSAACGIEYWAPGVAPLGRSNQKCGLEDINGDGLVDRVAPVSLDPTLPTVLVNAALLGTGNLNAPFSDVRINCRAP